MIANFWNLPSLLKYCEIKKTSTKKIVKVKTNCISSFKSSSMLRAMPLFSVI